MKISARVIADSINPDGERLTTVEGTFNRWLLSEFNTHRDFSRNSASSRAIPVKKIMSQVWKNPALPIHWGANRPGMQAKEEISGWRRWIAIHLFKWARIPILLIVWILSKLGLHKQTANRLLEPWVWHVIVFTTTEFRNFFKQRLHPDAQPEFQLFARCVKDAVDASVPRELKFGEWHLPYTDHLDDTSVQVAGVPQAAYVSAARCAATSYARQGEVRDPIKDLKLCGTLVEKCHWSPLEHTAQAVRWCKEGNFRGWKQLRKFYAGEDGRS